jgi:dTMP kinase
MMKQNRGIFICVEGLDGSGKTTQAKRLVNNLRLRGFDAVYTTEPTKGEVGRLIRRFVLNREKRVPATLEALSFAADRIDHVENEIMPFLKQDKVVVCDRYVHSSLAYQGATGLNLGWIEHINQFALKPNLSLLIDAPTDVVVKRLKKKKTVMETAQNLKKVREIYMNLAQKQHLTIVDGDKSINEVAKSILDIVLPLLKSKPKV